MENTIYKKSEKGYILRQRNTSVVILVIIILCLGAFFFIGMLTEWSQKIPPTINPPMGIGVFLACVIIAIVLLRSQCCSMFIEEKGIHFRRPLAKTKFFAWEEVQDWGFAYMWGSYTRVHILYFSKRPLKPTRREKSKRLPLTYRKTIYICIEGDDLSALKNTGVIGFCKRCLERSNKTAKNYVPMFICEWTNLFW